MDFNELNLKIYQQSAPHRFSKKPSDLDRGYMKISDWIGDVCFYYEQKRKEQKRKERERLDEEEFIQLKKEQKEKIEKMPDSGYKKGLAKAIEEI